MSSNRRYLLKAGVATGAGSTAVGLGSAAHDESQPEHVSIGYNQRILDKFRPELVIPESEQEKFMGLYGLYATSTEFDYGCCVYWCEYTHQEGWLGNLDSHYGDHEPCYVFFDEDTEEVVQVVASVYHWIAGRTTAAETKLNDTHVRLRVVKPWHQYTVATDSGDLYEVKDLTSVFDSWLENGLEESMEPGLVYNPWKMLSRGDWWRRGEYTGLSTNQIIVRASKGAGIGKVGSLSG